MRPPTVKARAPIVVAADPASPPVAVRMPRTSCAPNAAWIRSTCGSGAEAFATPASAVCAVECIEGIAAAYVASAFDGLDPPARDAAGTSVRDGRVAPADGGLTAFARVRMFSGADVDAMDSEIVRSQHARLTLILADQPADDVTASKRRHLSRAAYKSRRLRRADDARSGQIETG